MTRRLGALVGALVLALFGIPGTTGAQAADGRQPARVRGALRGGLDTREQIEEDLAWLVNQRRAEEGLAPLRWAPSVRAPARRWAEAQAAAGEISHREDLSPYPGSVPGLSWSLTGENVGHAGSALANGTSIMTSLDQAFYDSPTHRANVLGSYTHLAVGVNDDGEDLFVTVAFVDWKGAAVPDQRLPASALHDMTGALDSVVGEEGGVRVVGWVADPDGEPVLDVTTNGTPRTLTPSEVRPDLASVPGAVPGLENGLNTLLPAPPGRTDVCAEGAPVGFGAGLSLGCTNVIVPQGWDGLVGVGGDAHVVAYAADGLLPGAERPPEPPSTEEEGLRRAWSGMFPATLQRYRADDGDEPPTLVFADPLGRLHWQDPDGTDRVARPSAGELTPGRPPVDLGDVDGDGDDDLVVLVRSGAGWALTGFEDADPAKPLPVTERPDLDGWTSVHLSVLPQRPSDGEPMVRSGPLRVTAGTVVVGRRRGDGPLVASIGGGAAIEIAAIDASAEAIIDVEWVDLGGGDPPDAVVIDRQRGGQGSRVRLLPGAGRYRAASQTVTVPGHPVDLEAR